MIDLKDFCSTLQQDLSDLVGANLPAYKREQTGLLDALVSSENTSAHPDPVMVTAGNGKKKRVIVEYLQPGLESETSNVKGDVCADAEVSEEYNHDIVTVEQYRRSPILEFTKEQMRTFCQSPSEHRAAVVSTKMNALFKALNKDIATQFALNVGGFYGGAASGKNVPLLASDGVQESAYMRGEVDILEDMADLSVDSRPILCGSGVLSRYARYANIGCCNQYGTDISALGDSFGFYRDVDIDAVVGSANNIFGFAPGAVQFLEWNENEGEFEMEDVRSIESTIVDPVTGITLDFEMHYNRCTKVYQMFFAKNWELYFMPDAAYKTGDPRHGTNNAFHYVGTVQTA